MIRKEKRANNPFRKNIALNTEKNAVFTAKRYSVFLLKRPFSLGIVNGRDILMEKTSEEKCESLFSCDEKDFTPFRQKNKKENLLRKVRTVISEFDHHIIIVKYQH
ncbi:hypothetical protein TNCV_267091 [Trichonephila clavipes]|nr:hypothetical protein TNCV_267091 [Trichonephila clavipes]